MYLYKENAFSFFTILFCIFLFPSTLYSKTKYTLKDTTLIESYYQHAIKLDRNTPYWQDSALYYMNKALSVSQAIGSNKYNCLLYKHYGNLLDATGNYSQALNYYYKTLDEIEKLITTEKNAVSFREEYAQTYVSMGITHFHMQNTETALSYFEKALQETELLKTENKEFDSCYATVIIYINMSSVYIDKKDFITARQIFEKALSFIDCIEKTERYKQIRKANIYNNIGIVHRELQEYDKAFDYYYKAIEIYNEYNLTDYLPQVYNNLAANYFVSGEENKAIQILKKSIDLCQQYGNLNSEKIALNTLAEIYNNRKDYYNALLMTKKDLILTENLLTQESQRQIIQAENYYQHEKLIKQEKLEQEILLARKEKRVLIYIITIVILGFTCIILMLFFRNTKIKIRQQQLHSKNLKLEKQNLELENSNLELQKQNLELKNNELSQDVNSKNKELTTYVMYLNQKNTFITSIMEELKTIYTDEKEISPDKLADIIRQMKRNVEQTSWEEFEVRFQQVHQDFYKNLNTLAPNLTLNEKRLCAFLRLDMTTKEIAALTFQSIKSIQIARVRLRNKLQIEKHKNLISVLQQL